MKITDRDRLLLSSADKHCLSDTGGEYYMLGGHGCVPVRYNWSTLPRLRRMGLLTQDQGVWRITEKGRSELTDFAP